MDVYDKIKAEREKAFVMAFRAAPYLRSQKVIANVVMNYVRDYENILCTELYAKAGARTFWAIVNIYRQRAERVYRILTA